MSFRKTVSWIFFPFTIWYSVGVWFRNLLFDLGLKKQTAPSVTTIGVGNLCAGGTGKTPHVEYLLRMLSDQYRTTMLSRGYGRKSRGFLTDDGSHNATTLGDEPAMVARKFPKVQVAVCEKRLEGIDHLMAQENPPQLVVMDDTFQHRYVKPTVNILLTEYGKPFYDDHVMPFGDLREGRNARYRANIVVVTKSPETLNPIDRHNITNSLKLMPYQKVFFSYMHYADLVPLGGGKSLTLTAKHKVLLVTGIAHPEPMLAHLRKSCEVTHLAYADHHRYSTSDIKRIRKAYEQLGDTEAVIVTTEKDAARLYPFLEKGELEGLPIYCQPIEVRMHQNREYNFDQSIQSIVGENILFQHKMQTTTFNSL